MLQNTETCWENTATCCFRRYDFKMFDFTRFFFSIFNKCLQNKHVAIQFDKNLTAHVRKYSGLLLKYK